MNKYKLTNEMTPAIAIHPGELLFDELTERKILVNELSKKTKIPEQLINKIINKKKNITIEIALKFEKFFNIGANFWLKMQYQYEIDTLKINKKIEIEKSNLPKQIQKKFLASMNLL